MDRGGGSGGGSVLRDNGIIQIFFYYENAISYCYCESGLGGGGGGSNMGGPINSHVLVLSINVL